jgi:phosphohistidine swiveling domain-containing protein
MYIVTDEKFEFEWPDASMADLTWHWDRMHCPAPLPPLASALEDAWTTAAFGAESLHVNGYSYMPDGGEAPPEPGADHPIEMSRAIAIWEEERLPEVREVARWLRDDSWKAMGAVELAGRLPEIYAENARAFALTMKSYDDVVPGLTAWLEFCAERWGRDGASRGMTMLQGHSNATLGTGVALEALADQIAGSELGELLLAGQFEAARTQPGAEEFWSAFDAYLAEQGWRLPTWMEIHTQTWAEDESIPLSMIRQYLAKPEGRPSAAAAKSADVRAAAIARAEADLADEAGHLERLRTLREGATGYIAVVEGRALYQQMLTGSVRVPLLALARQLVETGSLRQPDDIFFLTVEEVQGATTDPDFDMRAEVMTRREQFNRWSQLIPPLTLGAPPGPPSPIGMLMSGKGLRPSEDSSVIKGFAASAGTVQGIARVISDPRELGRLEAGDILVCRFTAPTWTPAFAVAAAVVTDAGGILSHAAIAAREYALPAVVGTGVGTEQIADGSRITVDGGQGLVRLES